MVMLVVTVPTPPGTGVMASTMGSTSSKSTSPHSLPCTSKLMPTSSTVWPGRKYSRPYARARPVAQMTISAERLISCRFSVRLWQMVTLALRRSSIMDTGLPTTRLRPMTTTCLPTMGTL